MTPALTLRTLALAASALALNWPGMAQAHKAHQHGVAQMDVVLADQQLTIELDTPLDNLVGFERAPRTPAERERVEATVKALRQPAELFTMDAAAQCSLSSVQLQAPVLGVQDSPAAPASGAPSKAKAANAEHADLNARWTYTCAAAKELQQINVGLFAAFKGFRQIDTQMVRDNRQGKATLSRARATTRLTLPR